MADAEDSGGADEEVAPRPSYEPQAPLDPKLSQEELPKLGSRRPSEPPRVVNKCWLHAEP